MDEEILLHKALNIDAKTKEAHKDRKAEG